MKTTKFDAAQYLDGDETIAEYLNAVLERNDPADFVKALGTVARAKGMTQIAKEAGLGRESLYNTLSGEKAPRMETIFKVLDALGIRDETVNKTV